MNPDDETPIGLGGVTVVVTGASGGIGRMIAPALSSAGARLVLAARRIEPLEALAAELPGESMVHALDATDEAGNEALATAVVERWGHLDVWVSNAGVCPTVGHPRTVSAAEFRETIEVNLTGTFLGARAAAGAMEAGGRIIVTSSVLGQRPRAGFAHYAASKAGMEGLVRAMALDLADDGITVNAIAPGWFDSPLAEPWMRSEGRSTEILSHVPLGRWGTAGDLTGAYLLLASEASRFITGTVITVDGGYALI